MKKFIKKSRLLGVSAIVSVALLLFGTLVFTFFNIGVDGAYGMNVDWSAVGITMAPRLLVLAFLFYLSLKILKDQELPIKKSNVIAFTLIGIGVAYFAYRTTSFWQDGGGWVWPVVYFLESLLFVVFGTALMQHDLSDARAKIKDLIGNVKSLDLKEQEHIEDAIKWIESGAEIFKIKSPDVPPKHLVSFSVLFDPKEQKILLLNHRKALLMLPSGGHLNKGEMPHEAAERELMEELGIEAKPLFAESKVPFFISQIVTVGLTAGHIDVDLWYVFEGDATQPINDGAAEFEREFAGYQWIGLDEILAMPIIKFDANMHRFVKKLKNTLLSQDKMGSSSAN